MFVFCIAVSIYAHISCLDNFLENVLAFQGIEILNFGEERQGSATLDFYVFSFCFVNVSGVAAYVGWQSSSILKPLLQQGLSDAEEFVIYKALNALTCMCQLGLLQKPHIYEFACDIGKLEYWRLPCFAIKENLVLHKASQPA